MDNLLVCALLLRSRPGSTVVITDQLDRPEVMDSHPFASQEIYPNHSIPISYLKYRTNYFWKKNTSTSMWWVQLDSLRSYLSIFMRYGYTMIHPWLP